nr:unnamed protein product [Digitaria exilis]
MDYKARSNGTSGASTGSFGGRFKEAEDDCTEALNLDDRYIKAYSRRITARKELGKLKEAMDDAEFAISLDPNNPELRKQYSEIKTLHMEDSFMEVDPPARAAVEIRESASGRSKGGNVMQQSRDANQKPRPEESVKELASRAASRGDAALAVSILENLARVPRFDLIIMCLSSMHKSELRKIWDQVFLAEKASADQGSAGRGVTSRSTVSRDVVHAAPASAPAGRSALSSSNRRGCEGPPDRDSACFEGAAAEVEDDHHLLDASAARVAAGSLADEAHNYGGAGRRRPRLATSFITIIATIVINESRRIKYSKEDVSRVFGLPCNGRSVFQNGMPRKEIVSKVTTGYLGIQAKGNRSIKAAQEVIERDYGRPMSQDEENAFKAAFVIYVASTLLAPGAKYDCPSVDYWNALADPSDIDKYDWADYVIRRLFDAVLKVKSDLKKGNVKAPSITGCSLFLQLSGTIDLNYEALPPIDGHDLTPRKVMRQSVIVKTPWDLGLRPVLSAVDEAHALKVLRKLDDCVGYAEGPFWLVLLISMIRLFEDN